jgi:hypothetical protein
MRSIKSGRRTLLRAAMGKRAREIISHATFRAVISKERRSWKVPERNAILRP